MPPALETCEFEKQRQSSAKRKLRYFKDESNVANMRRSEPLFSSSTTTEGESWQHAPSSNCFGDHCENLKDRPLPLTEQSSRLSRLSLIDQRPVRTDEFKGIFGQTLQKKPEVDRSKRSAARGFHRRQGSGDLYIKLEAFDSGDFVSRSANFQSSRYVVKGHGSCGDFSDSSISSFSESAETTIPTKTPAVKSAIEAQNYESSPSGALCLKEEVTSTPGTSGVGGVSGLKEWFKNRTLILKATSKAEVPPKSKYLRKLVLSSWKHNGSGGAAIFNILGKRPLQSSPVVAVKALTTIHKLMQQGPADCRAACYSRLHILTDTLSTFKTPGDNAAESLSYGPLICAYASMLSEKATFHHRFQAYENNYSVDIGAIQDQPSCSGQTVTDPLRPEALVCLQVLQDLILRTLEEGFTLFRNKYALFGAKDAGTRNGTASAPLGPGLSTTCGGDTDPIGLVVSVLIPVLREADLVYDICCFLLKSQLNIWRGRNYGQNMTTALNEMAPKFGYQHKVLRTFFEQAKTIDAITCNVTPPNLPQNPPYPSEEAKKDYSRLLPKTDHVMYPDHASTRQNHVAELDSLSQPEGARPKSVPVEGSENLEVKGDFIVREVDISWMSVPVQALAGGKVLPREDVSGPVLGGVGAAAAAAIQRFAAGQAEARRAAAATAESGVTAPTGLRKIRLEPPPGNFGTSFHLELGTIVRPGRPQHTRGTGRTWSSFDDEVFLHQQLVENPWSPFPRLVSPKFFSPRAPGQSKHIVQGLLSPVNMDSTSPLLFGFVGCPSPMNRPVDPFIGSPPSAILAMEVRPSPRLAIGPPSEMQHYQTQSPELQALPKYSRVETPPLIELETVVEEQSTYREARVSEQASSSLQQGPQMKVPASWRVEGSMSEAAAWGGHKVERGVGEHSRKTSLSDIPFAADWEIPICELKLGPKIGQGAFGDVLRGTWQGTDVAVKRLQNNASYTEAIVDIRHEVAVIIRLRHPNIILFMGACTIPPDVCIVMEFAANGSLYGVLHNPNIGIDMATVVRWASEAARGMNYLHTRNPPVVHRDLKSVNLLVDGDWHIKVSDFGLAMTKQSSYAYTQVGTWGWMAPEVLESAPYDEKADVYSFGVVLWELITREEPFRGYHPMQIMRAIDRGERPTIPESCPHTYKQLVEDCWLKDPNGRPMFEEILARLGAMSINLFEIQR
ncbi:hypothetical protein Mapa_014843 [Marchantia paleacea]|nr:hypothetical protein Mapa_014843 [Marchantia paleacea]